MGRMRRYRLRLLLQRSDGRGSASVRIAGSIPLFAVAGLFALRSWYPLDSGYFSDYPDSPDGLYLTVAATGIAIAALFAAAGSLVIWRRLRAFGGFLVLAGAAAIASTLPYMLFKWTSQPDTWPWAFFVQDWIAWLHFAPRPRSVGIAIQIGLAVVVAASVLAQVVTWSRPVGGGNRADQT
jgi:hypothetical protein